MTYKKFDKDRVSKLLENTPMFSVFNSVMKTCETTDFHSHFDFSYNQNVCFSSDYGGENNQSNYYVYTFTFFSYSSLKNWMDELNKLKQEKGYSKSAEYKKISPETRNGKLGDWMKNSEKNFKGIIVSFAVDKQVGSLFASSIDELYRVVKDQECYKDCNLSAKILEKAFRVSHFSNLILSQILCNNYGFFWMTDKDSIVQGENRQDFTIKIHNNTLKHYCEHLVKVTAGYGTPFTNATETDNFSEDFLSPSDLISGAIDDFANNHKGNKTPEELFRTLKPKSVEILTYLKKLPTFVYILDKEVDGVSCKRTLIDIIE